jgi:outer membrane protein OmpA-like peptidoglycan-associated protein
VTYSYTATGGKVSGTAANTSVDTTGLNAGNYTVTATATDQHVKVPPTCNASFAVKEWPAPTISCSANPTEVDPGQTSTINCNGSTAKGNLQYSYKSSAGNVSGEGPNATLNTQGAQPGPITVTGTVTDDRGKTASADTTVTVRAPQAPPPPPPPPQASKINQIAFTKPYSARVDNTAKAILDDVALRLQREPDSKLVIVGSTDAKEKNKARSRRLAAQRAANTKAYLVNEKGIDASRIETRTDGTEGAQAEMWIVPNGASFNEPNTEVSNMPTPKARPAHRRARKAAAKKAPVAK